MGGSFYFPSIDYINNKTLPGEKVMMIGAEMAYDLNRPYVANAGWNANEWNRLLVRNNSMEGVRDDLRRNGVTYILFSPDLFTFWTMIGSEGSGQPGGVSLARSLSFLPGIQRRHSADPSSDPDYQVQLRNWATFSLFASQFAEPVKRWRENYVLYRIK